MSFMKEILDARDRGIAQRETSAREWWEGNIAAIKEKILNIATSGGGHYWYPQPDLSRLEMEQVINYGRSRNILEGVDISRDQHDDAKAIKFMWHYGENKR